MKHQYFAPLCEEVKVSATSELLVGSPVGNVYLPVANTHSDVVAE